MLDRTDYRIIEELRNNGRMTMKQLGEKVHLTGQATATRVLKLEETGVIEGYTIKVNEKQLGYSVHAFINIYTKSYNHGPYFSVLESEKEFVLNNYKISGDGCYLLECKFPSNEELDRFLTALNKCVNYKLSIVVAKQDV